MYKDVLKAHISIDDVEKFFNELVDGGHKSIYDTKLIKFLCHFHKKYNAKFTLYGYSTFGGHNVLELPIKYKSEFRSCSNWLKFGFHWVGAFYNPQTADEEVIRQCENFYKGIERFAGKNSISTTIRIHCFHRSDELYDKMQLLPWFEDNFCLLCPEDENRECYDLSKSELNYLNTRALYEKFHEFHRSRKYMKSDLKVEDFKLKEKKIVSNGKDKVIYTHEWALFDFGFKEKLRRWVNRSSVKPSIFVRSKFEMVIKSLYNEGYIFMT
ncbi:MAG: hypothetical protein NC102_09960 [Clostridium sp.]|nr:hypothetical protein [Clostridium sp.]